MPSRLPNLLDPQPGTVEELQKSLEVDPQQPRVWEDLGIMGGGIVNGEVYTPTEC